MLKKYGIYYIIITLTLLAGACSTKKNTWVSRNYQALISNYNVYYNGATAFDNAITRIKDRYTNDYSHILPVYEFADEKAYKAGSSEVETALKKAHKLIQLHSITVKPQRKDQATEKQKRFYAQEEFNILIDDAYLLIGKANVVNHSEEEAIEIFDYLSRKYEGAKTCYEGKIWKAIAYTQTGQYANAQSALESYDLDGLAPIELYPEYMAAYANIYITQQKYSEAIPYMEKAALEIKDKHCRRRYKYILAQLYRNAGRNADAAPLFLALSRGVKDYDMAFAAKLDLATVATTDEELQKAEKTLGKMSRDAKNEEQLDQIYYSLGKLEDGKGNTAKAISHYRKSIETSKTNDNQKGLSFLALADIYKEIPQYIEASESLDSAAFYLDDANIRKKETETLAKDYAPIAIELRIIKEQDSLLRITNMSTKERERFIENIIEEHERLIREREEARLAEEEQGMTQSDFYQITGSMGRPTSGSTWYFYNQTMISAGKSTFASKWGKRKNEDDWRRSDKTSVTADINTATDDNGTSADDNANADSTSIATAPTNTKSDNISKETLMAGLPLTESAKQSCYLKIDNALFNSGAMLYETLQDYTMASKQLKEQTTRFTQSENRYNALVLLYFAQYKNNDFDGATTTSEIIRREYGNSTFASYLNTPDYFEEQAATRAEREMQYENTYHAYLSNNYNDAISKATLALHDTSNIKYEAKYLLIRALSHAKSAQTTQFKNDLVSITQRYSGTAEDSVALKLLALLEQGNEPKLATPYKSPFTELSGKTLDGQQTGETYEYRPDTTQSVICIVDNGMQNEAQFSIADYNFTNYIIEDFDIKIVYLADKRPAIIIRNFKDTKNAMSYFYTIREQQFWKQLTTESIPTIYVVSDNNIRQLLLTSAGEDYKTFFEKHYLNIEQ
jgi:outer membrane protein assembly factor BamD (BamD/ComL family)